MRPRLARPVSVPIIRGKSAIVVMRTPARAFCLSRLNIERTREILAIQPSKQRMLSSHFRKDLHHWTRINTSWRLHADIDAVHGLFSLMVTYGSFFLHNSAAIIPL